MTSESFGRITRATTKKSLEEKAAKAEFLEKSNENLRLELAQVQREVLKVRCYKRHIRTGKQQVIYGTTGSTSSN